MLSAVTSGSKNRQIRKQRFAQLFLVLFIAVSLMAMFTIIVNADHECIGDGCPICQLIRSAETLLTQIGKTIIAVSALYAGTHIIGVFVTSYLPLCADLPTPVSIKVRLNI